MILAPDGKTAARADTLPMSLGQCQWFTNGHALLRHVSDLKTALRLKLVCQRCFKAGLPEEVRVQPDPENMRYWITCDCSGRRALLAAEVIETDPLLSQQGWKLVCAHKCAELGMHDGIEAHAQDRRMTVRCGCTIRRYSLPEAAKLTVVH